MNTDLFHRAFHHDHASRHGCNLRKRACALLVLAFLSCAIPTLAELDPSSPTTHTVIGTVLDPSGASISGAAVSLLTNNGGTLAQTSTDKTGTFRFEAVPANASQIQVTAAGFQTTTVQLEAPHGALRIALSIAVDNPVISVGAEAYPQVSTETSENQNANTIDRAALDRLPVFDQDYIATMSRFLDDNAIGTNGVTLIVNGVEANGPGVTASAVQEVKINQNPYSAFYARPGRARLEITTKGGTPQFHGSLNFLLRDAVFDAKNAFAPVKASEHRQYYEGSVTGPLGHSNRNSFLLALDEDLDDQQAVVYAQGLNGPINESVMNPTHHFFGSGRIFHDLANGDQFWVGYSYERRTVQNFGVGGTVLPSAGTDTKFQEHEVNVDYHHLFSQKWINQLHFLLGHYDSPVTSLTPDPQVVVSGAFTGGGAQADFRRTEYHFDGTDFVTHVTGKHTIDFGVDIPDISRRGIDDFTNRAGTYTFGSLADYQANQPSTFLIQSDRGHVVFLERVVSGFIDDNIRLTPKLAVYLGMRYYFQNYFHDDANNFAPRFGFAYAPTTDSKTVIRGGAGMFYDRTGPLPIGDLLHFNGQNLLRFIVENPLYPITQQALAGVPTSLVVLDPHTRIPYTLQYSLGIERQITPKSTLSMTYVGFRGIDMFRSVDSNAPVPADFLSRPNPNFGQVRDMQSEGYQKSNALEINFRGKPTKYFSGQVQYTFSKTENNTSGITYFPANSYDPAADWALSDNDRRHKFDLLASTQPTKYFTFGVALSVYSSKPVNVTTGSDNNQDGIVNDRPIGYARNTMPGPGLINLDLNLAHDFALSKQKKEARVLSVAVNSFNVLNHTNDVTYVGVITSPFFGHAVAALPPRRMQLDLQFKF